MISSRYKDRVKIERQLVERWRTFIKRQGYDLDGHFILQDVLFLMRKAFVSGVHSRESWPNEEVEKDV